MKDWPRRVYFRSNSSVMSLVRDAKYNREHLPYSMIDAILPFLNGGVTIEIKYAAMAIPVPN